jgi:hypothetical protein
MHLSGGEAHNGLRLPHGEPPAVRKEVSVMLLVLQVDAMLLAAKT